jgi:hypothetical protein
VRVKAPVGEGVLTVEVRLDSHAPQRRSSHHRVVVMTERVLEVARSAHAAPRRRSDGRLHHLRCVARASGRLAGGVQHLVTPSTTRARLVRVVQRPVQAAPRPANAAQQHLGVAGGLRPREGAVDEGLQRGEQVRCPLVVEVRPESSEGYRAGRGAVLVDTAYDAAQDELIGLVSEGTA